MSKGAMPSPYTKVRSCSLAFADFGGSWKAARVPVQQHLTTDATTGMTALRKCEGNADQAGAFRNARAVLSALTCQHTHLPRVTIVF